MISAGVAYGLAAFTAACLTIGGVAVASPSDESGADSIVSARSVSTVPTTTVPATRSPPTTSPPTTVPPPVPVVIPSLGGLAPADARDALRDLGLEVILSQTPVSVGYAIGLVVASEPPEGTSLFPGDTVTVVAGTRPEAAFVERGSPSAWGPVDWVDSVDNSVGRCSVETIVEGGVGLRLDWADCAGPHDYQFLAAVNPPETFETREAAAAAARGGCDVAFQTFVGAPPQGSSLFVMLVLDWEAGTSGADGECLLRHRDDRYQLVGDAAGSLW